MKSFGEGGEDVSYLGLVKPVVGDVFVNDVVALQGVRSLPLVPTTGLADLPAAF